jgi:hypothetical protein
MSSYKDLLYPTADTMEILSIKPEKLVAVSPWGDGNTPWLKSRVAESGKDPFPASLTPEQVGERFALTKLEAQIYINPKSNGIHIREITEADTKNIKGASNHYHSVAVVTTGTDSPATTLPLLETVGQLRARFKDHPNLFDTAAPRTPEAPLARNAARYPVFQQSL